MDERNILVDRLAEGIEIGTKTLKSNSKEVYLVGFTPWEAFLGLQ